MRTKPLHQLEIEVYADYYQFYFCEKESKVDTSVIWDQPNSTENMLAVEPDFLAIGTKRYADVPVVIEFWDELPMILKQGYDRISETTISIQTVATIGNFISQNLLTEIPFLTAGNYKVRILYSGLFECY